jgi:hypothetical protein
MMFSEFQAAHYAAIEPVLRRNLAKTRNFSITRHKLFRLIWAPLQLGSGTPLLISMALKPGLEC